MQDCVAWILVCLFIFMTERDRTDKTCFKHTALEMLQKNVLNDALASGERCDSAHPDPAMANRLLELRAAKQKQIKTSEK